MFFVAGLHWCLVGRGCVEVGRLLACGSRQGIVALFKDTTAVGMQVSVSAVSTRCQVAAHLVGPCRSLLPPFMTWKRCSFRKLSSSVRSQSRNWLYSILVGHPLIRNQADQVGQTRCQHSGRTDPEQQESFPAWKSSAECGAVRGCVWPLVSCSSASCHSERASLPVGSCCLPATCVPCCHD